MRTITKSVGATLLVATLSLSAFADNGRGRYPHYDHRPNSVRSHGGDWVAPLLFLGLAGAVLSASAYQSSPAPVTYMAPSPMYVPAPIVYQAPYEATYQAPYEVAPAPPRAPANTWYFCQSVGKYYPYAQHCPEGWQPVAGQRY